MKSLSNLVAFTYGPHTRHIETLVCNINGASVLHVCSWLSATQIDTRIELGIVRDLAVSSVPEQRPVAPTDGPYNHISTPFISLLRRILQHLGSSFPGPSNSAMSPHDQPCISYTAITRRSGRSSVEGTRKCRRQRIQRVKFRRTSNNDGKAIRYGSSDGML